MTCVTYTEDIMKSVLIGFKKNNNLENIFFNLSYYSQRDPPKYFKSKYDTESVKVQIYYNEVMIVSGLLKIIATHTKDNNFLIIHVFRCRDVNDKYVIEYSLSTIPMS